jgi:hypothetical protein
MRGNMTSSDIIASAVYGMKKKKQETLEDNKKKKEFSLKLMIDRRYM